MAEDQGRTPDLGAESDRQTGRVPRNWDSYWKDRVYLNARMSTCIRLKVGAVAVRNRRSFADAFNGNIPGERHCDDGGCDYCTHAVQHALPIGSAGNNNDCVCVHAESNLVSYCAVEGIKLAGAIVYCTDHPCVHCVKLLASSGVREVVYDREYPAPDWAHKLMRMTIRQFSTPTTKPDLPHVTATVIEDARLRYITVQDEPGPWGGRIERVKDDET